VIDNEILVPQLHFVTQRVQTLITSCHSLLMKQLLHRTQILPTWNASEIKHMFDVLHKFSAVIICSLNTIWPFRLQLLLNACSYAVTVLTEKRSNVTDDRWRLAVAIES